MKPFVLAILDGWGIAPAGRGNAITLAKKPNLDRYFSQYPHSILQASGPAVGLPPNEDGNSEVGHLNIGSGRIVYQELPRINIQIADGQFFENPVLKAACAHAKNNNSHLALMGLIGPGTVHSSSEHLYALLKLAAQEGLKRDQVHLHLFSDGRDSDPKYASKAFEELIEIMNKYNIGVICSVSGRYYGMDRNRVWERTEKAYRALTEGIGEKAESYKEALQEAYKRKLTDEFIMPTLITDKQGHPLGIISDNDAVIFYNYRADRARQLTDAFVLTNFKAFERTSVPKNLNFTTMTEYEKDIPVSGVAYRIDNITMGLTETLSRHGLKQFHIAETEKYAHVTYFFNGRREEPFMGEERFLVPSPHVETYDLKPEMSASEITEQVLLKLKDGTTDLIVLNFANTDMVAHTGNLVATISAVEHIDKCIGQIVEEVKALNGTAVITSDHGNAEEKRSGFLDRTETTKHTTNPVPFLVVSEEAEKTKRKLVNGVLGDVAPTILYLMDLAQPMEMTGRVLFE